MGNDLAVHLHRHVQRTPRQLIGLDEARLDFNLHLAGRERFLGADLRPLDLEEVVLVAEDAVLHEAVEN